MGKKKKMSERQEMLNRHYSGEILKVLSKPVQDELEMHPEKKQSDISYAEAKCILKHTIRQIEMRAICFKCCD